MTYIDIIVIVILLVLIILAYSSMRKQRCHDCSNCHKQCGRVDYGKKLKEDFRNQRKPID